jgi:hypothetical protein
MCFFPKPLFSSSTFAVLFTCLSCDFSSIFPYFLYGLPCLFAYSASFCSFPSSIFLSLFRFSYFFLFSFLCSSFSIFCLYSSVHILLHRLRSFIRLSLILSSTLLALFAFPYSSRNILLCCLFRNEG